MKDNQYMWKWIRHTLRWKFHLDCEVKDLNPLGINEFNETSQAPASDRISNNSCHKTLFPQWHWKKTTCICRYWCSYRYWVTKALLHFWWAMLSLKRLNLRETSPGIHFIQAATLFALLITRPYCIIYLFYFVSFFFCFFFQISYFMPTYNVINYDYVTSVSIHPH